MKTIAKMMVWVGLSALVVGCGGGDRTKSSGPVPQEQLFEIRLLGQDPGALTAALFSVSSVVASANGNRLTVEPALDAMDLTATNQAWLLGRVRVPEGVRDVDFTLRFDDAGGYQSRSGNGAVESRGATVTWRAPLAWLQTNGHTVVQLDLDRSLVRTGPDSARLVPSVAIHY